MKLLNVPRKCRRVIIIVIFILLIFSLYYLLLHTFPNTGSNSFFKESQSQLTNQLKRGDDDTRALEPLRKFYGEPETQNGVNPSWFESELHHRFWKWYKNNVQNSLTNFSTTKMPRDSPAYEGGAASQKNFLQTFKNLSLWSPVKILKFDIKNSSTAESLLLFGTQKNNFGFGPYYDSRMVAQLLKMDAGLLSNNSSESLKTKQTKKKIAVAAWWPPDLENNGISHINCPTSGSTNVNNGCELHIHKNDQIKMEPVDAYIVGSQAFNFPPPVAMEEDEATVRIFITAESPYHSPSLNFSRKNDILASYWRGSGIQTPYAKWVYYDPAVRKVAQNINYAREKRKTAAIVVSNCESVNGRLAYVKQLQKYMEVDVYGRCGHFRCDDRHGSLSSSSCFQKIGKEYRFYLAFENSNCRDYITEKFFVNALKNSMVPVVLGAHIDDYRASAPENSFIHVEDFETPKELAHFLNRLMTDDQLYEKYFEWRGTGEFIKMNFLCRVCSFLFDTTTGPPQAHQMGHHSNQQRQEEEDNGIMVWAPNSNLQNPMCLPKKRWYWSRPND